MHAPKQQPSQSTQPSSPLDASPSLDAGAQIEALKQQLAEAQKMTALGELVSTTTHEFNNVLMTILNYAKMGLRNKDAATHTKCFEKILAASTRATKITNAVLGVARNRSTHPEPTDLEQLLDL
jgi:C4-dicarboxylate-specific signal transduction histidine kinase